MPNILIKNPLTKQTMQPQAYPLCQAALTQLCSVSGIGSIYPRERTLTMPVATCRRQLFSREPGDTSRTSRPRALLLTGGGEESTWGSDQFSATDLPTKSLCYYCVPCKLKSLEFLCFSPQTFSYMQHLSGGSLAVLNSYDWETVRHPMWTHRKVCMTAWCNW